MSENEKQETNFTHTTIGMFKDAKTGYWAIVTIPYDPVTNSVGVPVVEMSDDPSRQASQLRFKMTVSKRDII